MLAKPKTVCLSLCFAGEMLGNTDRRSASPDSFTPLTLVGEFRGLTSDQFLEGEFTSAPPIFLMCLLGPREPTSGTLYLSTPRSTKGDAKFLNHARHGLITLAAANTTLQIKFMLLFTLYLDHSNRREWRQATARMGSRRTPRHETAAACHTTLALANIRRAETHSVVQILPKLEVRFNSGNGA